MRTNGNGHRTETPDVSHIRNVEVKHEASDVNARAVLTFIVVLTLVTAGVSVGLWFLFKFLNQEQAKGRSGGPLSLRNLSEEERLPPAPRLQSSKGFEVTLENGERRNLELAHPQAEYEALRDQWKVILQDGLKDSNNKTVGVPIEDAIKRIGSGEGLQVRTKQAPGKLEDYAISIPTDTSSGRETMKFR